MLPDSNSQGEAHSPPTNTNSLSFVINLFVTETINGVTFTVKKLKRRGPRKGETWSKDSSSGKPGLGSHDVTKGSYVGAGDIAIRAGRMGTLNPVQSLGRQYSGDKDAVAANAKRQHLQDRRDAARDRLMEKIDNVLAM